MENAILTNYKCYEDENGKLDHFYEFTNMEDVKCYYGQSENGDSYEYGTEVRINSLTKEAFLGNLKVSIEGPFEKIINVINYQGIVMDCLNSDIGVYNIDNTINLFGSGCLDLTIGSSVTFYNLHLVHMPDMSWIFRMYGSGLKDSTHILVYCPAFSSYLEGSDNVSYDNLISTKSNFSSLTCTDKWLRDSFKLEFPGFKGLDELSAILFAENQSKGAQFIGHCEKCYFTRNLTEFTESLNHKKLLTAQNVKESFHKIKMELQESSENSNQVFSKYEWMRTEIVQGIVTRKNSSLFELISGEKTILLYSEETSGFNPPDGALILIFNAIKLVEIFPKLRASNSSTVKAYLWISPMTKIWSPSDFFWSNSLNLSAAPGFILCKTIRKYLILKDFNGQPFETTVIHVESEKGTHCFYLNPAEKYYGIISASKEDDEALLTLRHFINESCFKESDEPFILPSSAIIATLSCPVIHQDHQGPLQVNINDLPYLSHVKGLQFFSLKLRFFSMSTLTIRLICAKCKSQVEANRCLAHFEAYTPALMVCAVFDASDLKGSSTNVLIDKFSFFEAILGTDNSFKNELIQILKFPGKIKLSSEYFAFIKPASLPESSLEMTVANLIPRVSKVFNCTFPANMINSALKPVEIKYCDPKIEIINLLKLF